MMKAATGETPPINAALPNTVRSVLGACAAKDPTARPKIEELAGALAGVKVEAEERRVQEHLARARALVEAHDAAAAVEEDDLSCRVCMDGEGSHAFVPCGHRCVCAGCSFLVMRAAQPLCPYCRAPASSSVQTFG
jgi:hypothetical protein